MTPPLPGGLFVPVTTPFRAGDGEIDEPALRGNIVRILDAGTAGIVVGGSTGEAALLAPDEQRRLVAAARGVVPPGRWLVAGTGAESTRATIAATRAAAEEGADAAMVRAPAYYGATLSPEALERHFRAVADASPVPLFLYNIPKYTHVMLPPDIVGGLAGHPRVIGLKDSSGDMRAFESYRRAAPALRIFVGSLGHVRPAVECGAVGGVLAAGCFMAAQVDELLRLAAAGGAAATELQERLAPIGREIVGRLGIPGIKYAMDLVGLRGGDPRPPLMPLDDPGRVRVRSLVHA